MLTINREKALVGAFVTVIGYSYINVVLNCIISSVIGANSIDTAIQIVITIGFCFLAMWADSTSFFIPLDCIIGALILAFIIGFTAVVYPENYTYMKEVLGEIWIAFFAYYIIRLVDDTELILRGLQIIVYFAFVSGIFLALTMNGMFYIPGGEGVGYMVYGYKMLPAAILAWYFYQKTKKIHMLIISIISAICILMFGSRGAFVSFLGFVILAYFLINKDLAWKKTLFLIAGVIAIIVLTNQEVILVLNNTLSQVFKYDSRTLTLIIEESVTDESGRDILRELGYQMIRENWLFGAGPYADRTIVHPWLGTGSYIHNFFLEILIDFGIPIGIFIFYYIFAPIIKAIRYYEPEDRELVIIFLSLWLFEHLFSGTFWTNPYFYVTLALNYSLTAKYRDIWRGR